MRKVLLQFSLLLISSSEAFVSPPSSINKIFAEIPSALKTQVEPKKSRTQLNWGVIVPVPDDFFTITGISLGFAYTILRSWNRVTVENVAWENRLEDARLAKLDEEEESGSVSAYTELDLRKIDAEASRSSYGPEAMERREKKRRSRVQTLERDEYYDEDDDEAQSDRVYSMTDEEINDFEETYGIAYDPYYDEHYYEEEEDYGDEMDRVQQSRGRGHFDRGTFQ